MSCLPAEADIIVVVVEVGCWETKRTVAINDDDDDETLVVGKIVVARLLVVDLT